MKPEQLRVKTNYLWRLIALLVPLIFAFAVVNQAVISRGLSPLFAFFILLFALVLYLGYAIWCYIQSKK